MALQRATYRSRDAEHTVLHTVIREHLEPFLQAVADQGDGGGLPRFVEQEFRDFLRCGVLAQGFKLNSTALTSTPTSGFPPTIAPAWSNSVAISSVPHSPRTASASAATGASSLNSKRCGAMEHLTSSSSPSNSWRSWRPSFPGPR